MMAQNRPKLTRQLRITFFNADGVSTQRHLIKYFLQEHNIDIFLLNESHLEPYHRWKIPNYTILRTDRPGLKGGTAIIFKNYLPIDQITLPALHSIEATGAKLQTQDSPIILIAAYKPPNIPLSIQDIQLISALGNRILIAGDINSKHSYWNSRISNQAGKALYHSLPRLDVTVTYHSIFTPWLNYRTSPQALHNDWGITNTKHNIYQLYVSQFSLNLLNKPS